MNIYTLNGQVLTNDGKWLKKNGKIWTFNDKWMDLRRLRHVYLNVEGSGTISANPMSGYKGDEVTLYPSATSQVIKNFLEYHLVGNKENNESIIQEWKHAQDRTEHSYT